MANRRSLLAINMNEETLRALPPQELIAQLIQQLGVAQATELRARDWGLVVGNPSRWEVRRPLLEVGDFVIFARFPDHVTPRKAVLYQSPHEPIRQDHAGA